MVLFLISQFRCVALIATVVVLKTIYILLFFIFAKSTFVLLFLSVFSLFLIFFKLVYFVFFILVIQFMNKVVTKHLICEFTLWFLSIIIFICFMFQRVLILIAFKLSYAKSVTFLFDRMSIWTKLLILLSWFILEARERIRRLFKFVC